MLESLSIRHIALIEEITIRFHRGLQVLTGETGAGKSIVVDAVNLILGGRADRELIRTGCERASVEAIFDETDNPLVREFLEREKIDFDGSTVTLWREISLSGKNMCRICGMIVPLNKLRDLAALMMDIHGQSEHQFLTDPDKQLLFLDQTGDQEHIELLDKVRRDCVLFLENHRAYAKLVHQGEHREEQMAALEKNLRELQSAALRTGEEAELREEKKRLLALEKRTAGIREIYEEIAAEESGASGLSRIKSACDGFRRLSEQDPSVHELCERCETLYFELEEITYQLSLLMNKNEFDPVRLEKVDNRLETIHRLEKKIGKSADELCKAEQELQEEYDKLRDQETSVSEMSAEHKRLLALYRQTARLLSESRKRLAVSFEQRMMKELSELGMDNAVFRVDFLPNESGRPLMPREQGDDRIEFLISPNPGEPPKSLARIASGGELSRLMLAVKTLEAARTGVRSMVFDEIDTGISGRMAQVVAEKMISISRERQVICVTHLPQIAAAADYQYLIRKEVNDGRTNTYIIALDEKGRMDEVGRMVSGADGITEDSTAYASRMLSSAEELKKQLYHS